MERLSVQLYRYNAKMILNFWALHPHLEDDWLEACVGWDGNSSFESHCGETVDDSDGEGPVGHCPVTLSSPKDLLEEPTIHDTTDDMCYAVDVCNRFSSLPVESAPLLELSVDETPANPVGNHSKRITESLSQGSSVPEVIGEAPILSMRCGTLQGSSEVDGSLSFKDPQPLSCPTVGTSFTTEDPKISAVSGVPSIPTIISAKNTSYSGKSGSEEDLALSIVAEPPYSRELSGRDEPALPIVSPLWQHPMICESPNSVVKEDQSGINLITERQCEAVEPPDDCSLAMGCCIHGSLSLHRTQFTSFVSGFSGQLCRFLFGSLSLARNL